MIKLYFISLHILLVSLIYLVYVKLDCIDFTKNYHNELIAFHLRIDKNLKDSYVVFLGDSHVQGLAVQEIMQPAVNFGMGSDTTEGVIYRLPFLNSIKRAKAVVLLIGFNDLRTKTDTEIILNLEKIMQLIPSDIPIIMSLLLPVDENKLKHSKVTNKRISLLNRAMNSMLSKYSNTYPFDISEKLKDAEGMLKEGYHTGDGIHLNALGYSVLIDQLKIHLQSILNKEVAANHVKQ